MPWLGCTAAILNGIVCDMAPTDEMSSQRQPPVGGDARYGIYTDRIGRQRAAATIRSNGVGGGIYSMASADVEARDQRMKPGDVSLVGWVR